jgi:N-methylhydantoinase B
MTSNIHIYQAAPSRTRPDETVDPITTEIIRHSLNSAANQMKRALIRTAYSPVIYDVYDFAAAIYDSELRLLAQAPSLPLFMGTLNFCIEAAVEAVGGIERLGPGDILLYNVPFGTGSHPQDATMVMPVFLDDGTLAGYTAIKAHWLDLGAKEPYCTDTVDVFQEGTIFPGVKLFSAGELVDDIFRMVLANTRLPKAAAGDIKAQAIGCRVGGEALARVVARFGKPLFDRSVEHMFDHGERVVRSYFETIPDGRYVAHGNMDNNGVDTESIPFEVVVEVSGSDVTVDYSACPGSQRGPINCPLPTTVSASLIAISMLAGANESPCDGHFRPLKVVTRPDSLFHAVSPSPCFLYAWPAMQAIDVIYRALADAMPNAVPASSGGDVCALLWWGVREQTGEAWATGSPHPIGQGASVHGDGATLSHVSESATRFAPAEVWESKSPWLIERVELITDSCGAGRYRGGLGISFHFTMLEDTYVTTAVERTQLPPWGLMGGQEGHANGVRYRRAGEPMGEIFGKVTGLKLHKGDSLELLTGGGGGYGAPEERDPGAVHEDVRNGYTSEDHARRHYPHAFAI